MLIKKIEFCDTDESSQPPPVPPRRKRSSTAKERPTKLERKHRAPPPLPPPAAPQRIKVTRKTPSPCANEDCSSAVSSTFNSLEYHEGWKCNLTKSEEYLQEESPKSSRKSKKMPKKPERSRSPSPFDKPPEPNKYPPLYFTFQDFQTVMEGSLKHEQQKFAENSEPDTVPFTDNIEFDNDREEIYFRVTTTDRPFKNILNQWSKSYDGDVEDFEKEPQGDHIFDDYMDRSNKANKHLLINQEYFSMSQDELSLSSERSTKVRFVIQSPSTSTPDTDLDYTSYKEFVDKQLQQHGSVQLTELNEEEILDASTRACENKSISEINISNREETEEDENASAGSNALAENQASNVCVDWKEDTKVISVAKRIGDILNCDEEAERNMKENVPLVDEEVDVYRDDTIDIEGSQEMNERRKLFIDSSLYNLSNEDEDWSAYLDREKIKSSKSSSEKLTVATENQEKEECSIENLATTVNVIPREVPKIELSTFDEKSVPESVRRNSFLEHMLNDDHPHANPEISEDVNCEVIAAHPKHDAHEEEEMNARPSYEQVPEAVAKGSPVIKSTETNVRPSCRINVSPGGKSAGEVKSDVLNELLTNFGAIKLRPVNEAVQETAKPTKETTSLAKTDETHEIKNNSEIKVTAMIEKPSATNSTVEEDTSAIVKQAPQSAERFDTDNKVKTPLAVNKDQIREAIAIIPGSVKNYIKYYEIQGEIGSINKLKDSMYKKDKKAKAAKKVSNNKKSTKSFAVQKLVDDEAVSSRPSSPKPLASKQQSCMKSLSPKPERKKSVQFDSEFTVINPPKQNEDKPKDEEDEGTFSSSIGEIRTKIKGKAPVKPDVIEKDKQPEGLNLKDERCNEAAAVICIQVGQVLIISNVRIV